MTKKYDPHAWNKTIQEMTNQESQMYICPKAKECKKECDCKKPHTFKITCDGHFNRKCPACIPVEPEQPTPTMPLIGEEQIKKTRTYNPTTSGCYKVNEDKVAQAQLDADMAWHNEQIAEVASKAVKEFAEEFIKKIISCPISFYPDQLEAIKQGIRAMVEKE